MKIDFLPLALSLVYLFTLCLKKKTIFLFCVCVFSIFFSLFFCALSIYVSVPFLSVYLSFFFSLSLFYYLPLVFVSCSHFLYSFLNNLPLCPFIFSSLCLYFHLCLFISLCMSVPLTPSSRIFLSFFFSFSKPFSLCRFNYHFIVSINCKIMEVDNMCVSGIFWF